MELDGPIDEDEGDLVIVLGIGAGDFRRFGGVFAFEFHDEGFVFLQFELEVLVILNDAYALAVHFLRVVIATILP
jgi:hypothetical protein